MYNAQYNSGVSPVIGIILMVAVTVALIALVTATVFDLGSDVSESPDATVQFDETDSTISAEVLRNENVGSLKLIAPNGNEIGAASAVGDSIKDSNKQTGNYQIVAEMPDGNEEVLTITSIESTSALNMSGTVSINPAIQGATVKAVDSNSNVIGSATTDSNGEYTIFNDPANADKIIVSVEGFSSGATSNPLYTSTSVPANSETVNIDFDETSTFDYTVGGSSATIVYNGSGTSSDPYKVGNTRQLQAMNNDLDAHYVLGQDIDASNTAQWNNGSGFDPIGYDDYSNPEYFNGSLDGDEHIIDGLYINRPSERNVAMIENAKGPIEIKDIRFTDLDVTGESESSTLINNLEGENVMIDNVTATGTITGGNYIGGLFGSVQASGVIKNTKSNVNVNTDGPAGGFVRRVDGSGNGLEINNSYATGDINANGGKSLGGFAYSIRESYNAKQVEINNSYATGNVEGGSYSGGFVSSTSGGITINNSYATGDVITEEADGNVEQVGGLVAQLDGDATVINSYSTGAVSGDIEIGGLVAYNYGGNVSESYATGDVSGTDYVGGLVGFNGNDGIVEYSYSTGNVSGSSNVGGLVGKNEVGDQYGAPGNVTSSYWDTVSSGQSDGSTGRGTGLTTSEMQGDSYNTDFKSDIVDNSSFTGITGDYPELAWQSE